MSVIYLRHKVHGTKVAISEEEAEADAKRGWERYAPKEREVKDPVADKARMAREEEQSMITWKAQQRANHKAA